MRRRFAAAVTVLLLVLTQLTITTGRASATPESDQAIPVLAFYYIWFDITSWDRAKNDYPTLGRYSSDDPRVMRQQIRWAKSAGITGFIVSWKSTPTNNRRLRLLTTIAQEEDFKLAMIYQGLDFNRQPLAVDRVAADFQYFRDQFSADPVLFHLNGLPLTIFSGTWAYSHEDLAAITAPVRESMLVLSTEKNVDGYNRVADVTDGDAYYWSSVNPDTHPNYPGKLADMRDAVRSGGKIWLAPFAPGFDARDVGGTKVVERKDGETLETQYLTARASSPDALGLISWNEFSENTYVEPSEMYGDRYLKVLRTLVDGSPTPPAALDGADSSSSDGDIKGLVTNLVLLAVFVVCGFVAVAVIARRRRKQRWADD